MKMLPTLCRRLSVTMDSITKLLPNTVARIVRTAKMAMKMFIVRLTKSLSGLFIVSSYFRHCPDIVKCLHCLRICSFDPDIIHFNHKMTSVTVILKTGFL